MKEFAEEKEVGPEADDKTTNGITCLTPAPGASHICGAPLKPMEDRT